MALKRRSPEEMRFAKMLVFAPPGHGKTFLLGTAQEDDRTYPMAFIDFESGTETLAGLDIDVYPVRSWKDANEVIEALESGDEVKIDGEWIDFSEYKSVGIDSISEWHRWALLHSLDSDGKSRRDPDLLEFKDYNHATVQLRRVLRRLRDLELHVFFSAHSKEVEEPRLGRIKVPDMSGSMADEVAGLVSTVGYLAEAEGEDGELERLLLLHDYPKYRIKVRTRWRTIAPTEIVDPDITSILDVLGYEEEKPHKSKKGRR